MALRVLPEIVWVRPLASKPSLAQTALAGIAIAFLAYPVLRVWISLHSQGSLGLIGVDYALYRDAALRWLRGDGYFLPRQLAGPYELVGGEVLYPPVALWLFVPFAFLPAICWWIAPIALLGYGIARMRPAVWTLPVMAFLFALPPAIDLYWLGQPTIWLPGLIALGLASGGWAVLTLLKPSLLVFAAIGINRRAWWLALALVVLLCLPFGSLWLDWVRAVTNSDAGPAYSLNQVPMMLIPVVAWLGRAPRTGDARRPPASG